MTKIETAPAPDFYGNAIFCDDIRLELEGKITYVGVYTGSLLVKADFPVTMPKFCIAISFAQRVSLFERKLKLFVFLPDDTDEQASVEADVQVPPELTPSGDPRSEYALMGSNLVFAPFVLEKPGLIKVRILRNGILHRVGSLHVTLISQGITVPTAS